MRIIDYRPKPNQRPHIYNKGYSAVKTIDAHTDGLLISRPDEYVEKSLPPELKALCKKI